MAAPAGRPPPGDADRPRRDGQDAAGAAGRGRRRWRPYPDGVWLVELAALADPALVPQAVAAAVGVREEPGRPLLATLTGALRPRRLLLLLDNCEHLLEACARLADALLRACPHLTVLATSREALGIAGETAWRVPSLVAPRPPRPPAPLAGGGADAVRGGAPVPRPGRGGPAGLPGHRRRTPRRWPRSASGWTACRWPSSWRRPGCACCPRRNSWPAWRTASGC